MLLRFEPDISSREVWEWLVYLAQFYRYNFKINFGIRIDYSNVACCFGFIFFIVLVLISVKDSWYILFGPVGFMDLLYYHMGYRYEKARSVKKTLSTKKSVKMIKPSLLNE